VTQQAMPNFHWFVTKLNNLLISKKINGKKFAVKAQILKTKTYRSAQKFFWMAEQNWLHLK
jgi:hypothetical protein